MQKGKRILALLAAAILFGLYLITFLLGILGSPDTSNWLMASIVMTVVVPGLAYAMMLVTRVLSARRSMVDEALSKEGEEEEEDKEDDKEEDGEEKPDSFTP